MLLDKWLSLEQYMQPLISCGCEVDVVSPMAWYFVENVADIPLRRCSCIPTGRTEHPPHDRDRGWRGAAAANMKTNKLREVVRMHLDQGITRFKCATIAEAEMAAVSGAPDVLLAYQPVGPNVKRFVHLVETFSGTQFAASRMTRPRSARSRARRPRPVSP